ncbi:MAG: hypothetical protein GX975_00040 [Clostridiales bacterium]|nr:hypothetical protein [Clostridiales bacterium]
MDYYGRCKTTDVIYIPPKERQILSIENTLPKKSFLFPPTNTYPELNTLVNTMFEGKVYENLVRYPPNVKLYDEAKKYNCKELYDKFDETYDGRLISLSLLVAREELKSGKNNKVAYGDIAFALLMLAMPNKSLEILQTLLKEYPDYVDALVIKGLCQMRMDYMKESITSLNKALDLQDSDDIRFYLGVAYAWSGYPSEAYRMFSSIQEQHWINQAQEIIENLKKFLPHVTGTLGDVHLPISHPISLTLQSNTSTYFDYKGKEKYLCLIRDKEILATPEEHVRQEFLYYLIETLGYPKKTILVEESLAHIDRELRDRVDILVSSSDKLSRKNLLMVECKAPNVPLDAIVGEQALRYNQILRAKYIVLTNLDETQVYYYDAKNEQYTSKMAIPNYEQLLSEAGIKSVPDNDFQWVRPDYTELENTQLQNSYLDIYLGGDIDKKLYPAILNLAFMLMDKEHKLQCPFAIPPFTILKDNGLTTKAPGNPGGGSYRGNYRWFSVQDENKRIYNVYLGVFGWVSIEDFGERRGKSYLVVAVDKNSAPLSILQINLGKHLRSNESKHELGHSGIRSRKPITTLMQYIEKRAPYLLGNKERIRLGSLDTSQNLLLSDTKTAEVVANIISYALLRFELREKGI